MTRIRKHTSAIHRRNYNRAKVTAICAAYNPANVFICYQVLDLVF